MVGLCGSYVGTELFNQSISSYRAIVHRRVLQCGYAESKRNVLRRILNVLTDGAVSTVQWKRVPTSRSSNRETTSSSVQVVRYEDLCSRRRGGGLSDYFARELSDENLWQNPCLFCYMSLLFVVLAIYCSASVVKKQVS